MVTFSVAVSRHNTHQFAFNLNLTLTFDLHIYINSLVIDDFTAPVASWTFKGYIYFLQKPSKSIYYCGNSFMSTISCICFFHGSSSSRKWSACHDPTNNNLVCIKQYIFRVFVMCRRYQWEAPCMMNGYGSVNTNTAHKLGGLWHVLFPPAWICTHTSVTQIKNMKRCLNVSNKRRLSDI